MAEFTASLGIPCMASSTTYMKYSDVLSEDIEATTCNVMKLAGIEEKRLALEAGDVDIDDILICPVIANGKWSKRSYYKMKYDAFSGAVSLFSYN